MLVRWCLTDRKRETSPSKLCDRAVVPLEQVLQALGVADSLRAMRCALNSQAGKL